VADKKKLKDDALDIDAFILDDLPYDAYYPGEEQAVELEFLGYSGFPWWHPFFIVWYPEPTMPPPLPKKLTRVQPHSGRRSKVSRRKLKRVFGLESVRLDSRLSVAQQEDALILMGKL
jgi:hypothetical protein